MQRGSPAGSGSTFRRSRPIRMSIERSNGSHSRLRVFSRSWSRVSTRFGFARKVLSRSNSIAVMATIGLEHPTSFQVDFAAAEPLSPCRLRLQVLPLLVAGPVLR
jgi:hypothetical protein